jgi:predicted Zn-dependent protease
MIRKHGTGSGARTKRSRSNRSRELSKTGEGSPEWLSLVAESRVSRRQYRSAFFFYKQALQKNGGFRPAVAGIAAVYRATNHPDWAAGQEQKAAALPKVDCVHAKQECDFNAGRFLEAANGESLYWRTRAYNELARQSFAHLGSLPETVEVHAVRAQIASGQGQYLEAAKEWRAALRLAPGEPRLEQQLAISLQAAGDHKQALPIFEKFLAAEPNDAELNFFVGESLLRLEQPDKAEPYLEKAARLDPKLLPAQASLGLTYVRLGKGADAIPHLESALPVDTDGSLRYQLARAYQSAGNAVKAKEMMAEYQAMQAKSKEAEQTLDAQAEITAP